jgi:hypothetical protein
MKRAKRLIVHKDEIGVMKTKLDDGLKLFDVSISSRIAEVVLNEIFQLKSSTVMALDVARLMQDLEQVARIVQEVHKKGASTKHFMA